MAVAAWGRMRLQVRGRSAGTQSNDLGVCAVLFGELHAYHEACKAPLAAIWINVLEDALVSEDERKAAARRPASFIHSS